LLEEEEEEEEERNRVKEGHHVARTEEYLGRSKLSSCVVFSVAICPRVWRQP
jgi:hypothetical protein